MESSAISREVQNIQKQGFLQKQSRFFKSWRQRWVVLTSNVLFTFKERRSYQNPTEVIVLKEIVSIKSTQEELGQKNSFKIQTSETTFYFMSDSGMDKQAWIGSIGKAMVRSNNVHIDD